jgi:hypothetical protein
MNRRLLRAAPVALVLVAIPIAGSAQHRGKDVTLHVNTRWEDCAFQLDPALTQDAWRQFTEEAALVAYLRPLTDARPLGAGRVEFSILQWATAIDDTDSAWNDTFVHPSEDHWLMEGNRLSFPGVMVRVGLSDRMDIGGYATKNPSSNYGFFGGQIQHNIINDQRGGWAGAGRMSFVSLFGPEDVELTVLGLDVLGSKTLLVNDWLTVSPYVGGSSYLSYSQERSDVVDLDSEIVPGSQAMIGAVAEAYRTRLAVEVSSARVQTVSFKLGVTF